MQGKRGGLYKGIYPSVFFFSISSLGFSFLYLFPFFFWFSSLLSYPSLSPFLFFSYPFHFFGIYFPFPFFVVGKGGRPSSAMFSRGIPLRVGHCGCQRQKKEKNRRSPKRTTSGTEAHWKWFRLTDDFFICVTSRTGGPCFELCVW